MESKLLKSENLEKIYYGSSFKFKDNKFFAQNDYFFIYNSANSFDSNILSGNELLDKLINLKFLSVFSIRQNNNGEFIKFDFNFNLKDFSKILNYFITFDFFDIKIVSFMEKYFSNMGSSFYCKVIGITLNSNKEIVDICLYYKNCKKKLFTNLEIISIINSFFKNNLNNIDFFSVNKVIELIGIDFSAISIKLKFYFRFMKDEILLLNDFYHQKVLNEIKSKNKIINNMMRLEYIQFAFNDSGLYAKTYYFSRGDYNGLKPHK